MMMKRRIVITKLIHILFLKKTINEFKSSMKLNKDISQSVIKFDSTFISCNNYVNFCVVCLGI